MVSRTPKSERILLPHPSDVELAYMAGIIDGEGCIYVPAPTAKYRGCQVVISNTDLTLLHWCQDRFGGYMSLASGRAPMNRERTKDCYTLRWGGGHLIVALLRPLLPYLVIKRAKAEAALVRCAEQRERQREAGRRTGSRPRLRIAEWQERLAL